MFDIYRPSGRFGAAFVAMALGLMLAAAAAGWAYQKGLELIPFIYVNFLLTGGLGLGIGFAVNWMGKTGHCRNRWAMLLVAVVAAAIGLGASHCAGYSAWKSSIEDYWTVELQENEDLTPEETKEWVRETMEAHSEELQFSSYIDYRIESGWSLGRVRSNSQSKPTLSGILVWIIWLIEAAIIFAAAASTVYNDEDVFPYSEDMGAWADEAVAQVYLDRPKSEFIKAVSESKTLSAMIPVDLPANDGPVSSFLIYSIHSVPGAPQESWMSVRHGRMRRNKKGEMKESGRYIVRNAKVGTQEISRVHALGEALDRYEQEG